jgi:hypothetical protein
MAMLITGASGLAANTGGTATAVANKDPVFVANNLLMTVYVWADNWGDAQVQLYFCPQVRGTPWSPVWFPVPSGLFTANSFGSFQHRWGQIKAEVTGATDTTSNLTAVLFEGN